MTISFLLETYWLNFSLAALTALAPSLDLNDLCSAVYSDSSAGRPASSFMASNAMSWFTTLKPLLPSFKPLPTFVLPAPGPPTMNIALGFSDTDAITFLSVSFLASTAVVAPCSKVFLSLLLNSPLYTDLLKSFIKENTSLPELNLYLLLGTTLSNTDFIALPILSNAVSEIISDSIKPLDIASERAVKNSSDCMSTL